MTCLTGPICSCACAAGTCLFWGWREHWHAHTGSHEAADVDAIKMFACWNRVIFPIEQAAMRCICTLQYLHLLSSGIEFPAWTGGMFLGTKRLLILDILFSIFVQQIKEILKFKSFALPLKKCYRISKCQAFMKNNLYYSNCLHFILH